MALTWSLYNNDSLIKKDKIQDYQYEENNFLLINDEYGQHKINLKSKIYEKNADNVLFRIDFVHNLCIIILDSAQKFEMPIKTHWICQDNLIELEYQLDTENKKIKVEFERVIK